MILVRDTAPSLEPVTVEEVKVHSRIDTDVDDAYIAGLIKVARGYVEDTTGLQIVTGTWKMYLDRFSCSPVELPKSPLVSVSAVKYMDPDGVQQTVDSSIYTVDTDSMPGRVYLAYGQSWPSIQCIRKAVEFDFSAGYGNPTDAPEGLQHAILMLVAHWYENRENASVASLSDVPMGVSALLDQYRIVEVP
jgi:uncharacterized phiE125 gp8 family phage protein